MSPAAKFYALVSSLTIFVMFWVLAWVVPIMKSFSSSYYLAGATAGILTSVGIYRLVGLVSEMIIQNCEMARKWIFGGNYIRGTWIGYFIGRAGDKRYVIEHIDQDLGGVVICGRSYTDLLIPHADWNSVAVSVDSRTGRLIFSYTLTIITRQGTNVGISSVQLQRKSFKSPATALAGHAQDLGDQVRVEISEIKISDELLPWSEALQKAKDII